MSHVQRRRYPKPLPILDDLAILDQPPFSPSGPCTTYLSKLAQLVAHDDNLHPTQEERWLASAR